MDFQYTLEYAISEDKKDDLSSFRSKFHIPTLEGKEKIYFTGNSLGLQPKSVKEFIDQELNDWAKMGVDGHFEAKNPWFSYHESFKPFLADIVGAKAEEVTPMGGLTANLHFLMVSFYQPKGLKTKILCEAKAFPSDQYALESQVKFHDLDPKENIIELSPREGEHHLREEDILNKIEEHKDELAMIMIGGVNYYTGQVLPMKSISSEARKHNIKVGFDLAHAIGNIELKLHDWDVDFAAWCSYKYLNSGPGGVAGIFVHERHAANKELKRFAGWWGTKPDNRFLMMKGFEADYGSDGWQHSNAPVLSMASHKAALEIHKEAGMERLLKKQIKLTAYLEFILQSVAEENKGLSFEVITPKERGCQLSILTKGGGKSLFNKMTEKGIIADWREPNVIRVAPVPLYNSYEDVYRFGKIISESFEELN